MYLGFEVIAHNYFLPDNIKNGLLIFHLLITKLISLGLLSEDSKPIK